MANKITYNIGFNVDSSGLKQVQTELQRMSNMSVADIKLINPDLATRDINKIKETAKKASELLQNSFNVKLDSYDLKKFNQELQKSPGLMNSIRTELIKLGPTGKIQLNNLTKEILTMNTQARQTSKVLDDLGKTFMNTLRWSVASSALNAISGSIQQAWGYTKKLDASLNDIRIVTGKSADEMERFAKQANKAAKGLGASTTAYTNASLIYYQQGLGEDDVQARTNVTLKAANVTGQSAAEVSQQLTAVWNGYKVVAEEAEIYVDKLAAVAATTAADLEELSDGMSKVASAANTMGVDIDQLSAQLATIVSVTRQDASLVGTALKTIYARMGDLKVSGVDEFGTSLGDVSGQMRQMGIEILDQEGNLRDMGAVIEEVASKWGTWTDAQLQAAAVAIAGKRQYNNLIALFENWNMYESALNTSQTSEGALQKQQETYMDSLEAHLNQLSVASEKLYDALIDNDAIKGFIDLLTGVVNIFGDITAGVGGAIPMLLSLGGVLGKIFNAQLSNGLKAVGGGIKTAFGIGAEAYGMKHPKEVAKEQIAHEMGWNPDHKMTETEEKMVDIQADKLKISKYLTEEQKKQFDLQIKIAAEKGNELERLKAEQKILKDETDEIEKRAKAYVKDGRISNPNTFASELKTEQANINKAKETFMASDFWKNKDELVDTTGIEAETGIAVEARKSFKDKTEKELKDYAKSFLPDSKGAATMDTLIKVKQQEVQVFQSLGDTGTKAYKELQEWQERFYKGGIDATTYTKKMAEAFNNAEKEAGELAVKIVDVAEASDKMKQDINDATLAVEQADNAYNDFKTDTEKGIKINQITETISSLTAFAGACMSIANIFKIVQDESLSTGEKVEQVIFAILGVIAAAIPAVVSMLSLLQVKATAALGWIGLILMAISLVTTLIISFASLPKPANDLEKANKALEEANKAADNARKAVSSLTNAYSVLKDEIKDFKDARKALDSMRQGTEEWQQAVADMNLQVLSLLEKYPQLQATWNEKLGIYEISSDQWAGLLDSMYSELQRAQTDVLIANEGVTQASNKQLIQQMANDLQSIIMSNPNNSNAQSAGYQADLQDDAFQQVYFSREGSNGLKITKNYAGEMAAALELLGFTFEGPKDEQTADLSNIDYDKLMQYITNKDAEEYEQLKKIDLTGDNIADNQDQEVIQQLTEAMLKTKEEIDENNKKLKDNTIALYRNIIEDEGGLKNGEVVARIAQYTEETSAEPPIKKITTVDNLEKSWMEGNNENEWRENQKRVNFIDLQGWFGEHNTIYTGNDTSQKVTGNIDHENDYAAVRKAVENLIQLAYGAEADNYDVVDGLEASQLNGTPVRDLLNKKIIIKNAQTGTKEEMTIAQLQQLAIAGDEKQQRQEFAQKETKAYDIAQQLEAVGKRQEGAFFAGDFQKADGSQDNQEILNQWQEATASDIAAIYAENANDPNLNENIDAFQDYFISEAERLLGDDKTIAYQKMTTDEMQQYLNNKSYLDLLGGQEAVTAIFSDEIKSDANKLAIVNRLLTENDIGTVTGLNNFILELNNADIEVEDLGSTWNNFLANIRSGYRQWIQDSDLVLSNLKTIKDVLNNLQVGDILDPEQYNMLMAISPELSKYYVKTADGYVATVAGSEQAKLARQFNK